MEFLMKSLLPYRPRRTAALLATLLLAWIGGPAQVLAQAAAPVLSNAQVTEDALVDALAIEPAYADEAASGATRGFRPAVRPGTASTKAATAPAKPAAPGKANLLITFPTGSAELTPETIRVLQTLGKALQSDKLAGFAFRIEGHADPRGTAEANIKLSEERAQAVAAYLSNTLGVLPDRLQPVGKGSSEPLNPQQPDAPENRRVTIVTTQ
jgi:outer membrane protein OmpA-like peptidoglycan-associated protein